MDREFNGIIIHAILFCSKQLIHKYFRSNNIFHLIYLCHDTHFLS
jgi:hypothetical protein